MFSKAVNRSAKYAALFRGIRRPVLSLAPEGRER